MKAFNNDEILALWEHEDFDVFFKILTQSTSEDLAAMIDEWEKSSEDNSLAIEAVRQFIDGRHKPMTYDDIKDLL